MTTRVKAEEKRGVWKKMLGRAPGIEFNFEKDSAWEQWQACKKT
jgi:hypothetical protein